jgi:hypothetical protein
VDLVHAPEFWSAVGSMGAFVVIAVSAFVAVVQLRHVRTGNQLQGLLSVERDFHASELQVAFRYCQTELAKKMQDLQYREELEQIGFIDIHRHPEMVVCNWFNQVGMLVKNDLVPEGAFLDLFGRLVDYSWLLLEPTIAVLRRRRGPSQYANFEYLAVRSQKWRAKHESGLFPRDAERLAVRDPWAEIDSAPAPQTGGAEA